MKNWRNLFANHILDRGENYYRTGAVTDVKKDEDGDYEAIVIGSDDYHVEINFDHGEIEDLWCDCPHAEDGNHCKHMAAVLYHLEDHKPVAETSDKRVKKEDFINVIEKLSEEQTKAFLVKLAIADTGIQNLILTTFASKISKTQISALKKQVKAIAKKYGGKYGFIEYRQANHYCHEVMQFMADYVQNLIDNHYLSEAFEVICYIFVMVCEVDLDDSNGTTGELGHECCEYFETILADADKPLKEAMFEWFSHERSGVLLDYMRDNFIHVFWCNHFNEQPFASKKLAVLDAEIELLAKQLNHSDNWSASYRYKRSIMERLKLMDNLETTIEEKFLYRQKFRHIPDIRQLEIEEYLADGDDASAIELLIESKGMDRNSAGYVVNYSKKLLAIYNRRGMDAEYKSELITYVFEYSRGNIEDIRKLKEICSKDEWITFREKLIEKFQGDTAYQILKDDGLYQRLFNEICRNQYHLVSHLNRYEDVLKPHFGAEMLEIYVIHVTRSAKNKGDRKHYKELISYLKKIATYPMGKEKAEEILVDWKIRYARRPSMMDELKKAGL